jgi:hypothetical protein
MFPYLNRFWDNLVPNILFSFPLHNKKKQLKNPLRGFLTVGKFPVTIMSLPEASPAASYALRFLQGLHEGFKTPMDLIECRYV